MVNAIFYYMGGVAALLFIGFFILNAASHGFIGVLLRVKMSRGKKFLVKVRGKSKDYFTTGREEDGFFIWRTASRVDKRAQFDRDCIYSMLGVKCIDTDEELNCVIHHNWTVSSGFDAEKFNDLYVRCLMKPSLEDKKLIIILVLLVITLLVALIAVYFGYANKQLITQVLEMQYNTTTITAGYGGI